MCIRDSYYLDLAVWNYRDALSEFWPHIIRSFVFAGVATILAFIIGYPLAYAMAFKAGKWRNVMMILVIAPFFTSFILRTIAWRQILADEGPVASTLNALHLLPGGHITETVSYTHLDVYKRQSPWPARWSTVPRCCCWTSRWARSTSSSAARCRSS